VYSNADLQLDVKGCQDVYASFDKYVEVERLEGDNKYHAEQHGLQVSSIGFFIKCPPPLHAHTIFFKTMQDSDILFSYLFHIIRCACRSNAMFYHLWLFICLFNSSCPLSYVHDYSQKPSSLILTSKLRFNLLFQDAKKGVLFIDFPPVLQLQLKRFEYDFMRDAMVKVCISATAMH
jgi:hypothetical protein